MLSLKSFSLPLIVGCTLTTLTARTSVAATLTPEDKNFYTLVEASIIDLTSFSLGFGTAPSQTLAGSGTYNSNRGRFKLSGTYKGLPLNLNYVETYKATTDAVNWNSTGNYGTQPFVSSGTVQF